VGGLMGDEVNEKLYIFAIFWKPYLNCVGYCYTEEKEKEEEDDIERKVTAGKAGK
jgi:hypothetical protein